MAAPLRSQIGQAQGAPAATAGNRESILTAATVVVVRAEAIERVALLATGHPFFEPLCGPDRIGVEITDDADWAER